MSNSSIICVDASIILRYVLQPENSTMQKLWQTWISKEVRLIAPTLLFYEVTNALYQQQKAKNFSPETIWQTLELTLDLPINLINEATLHTRALELASEYNLPATYDAHYLALAEWMNADLYTADLKLLNSLKPFKLKWVKAIE